MTGMRSIKDNRNLETALGCAVEKMLTGSKNRKVVLSSKLPPLHLPPVSRTGKANWEPAKK